MKFSFCLNSSNKYYRRYMNISELFRWPRQTGNQATLDFCSLLYTVNAPCGLDQDLMFGIYTHNPPQGQNSKHLSLLLFNHRVTPECFHSWCTEGICLRSEGNSVRTILDYIVVQLTDINIKKHIDGLFILSLVCPLCSFLLPRPRRSPETRQIS